MSDIPDPPRRVPEELKLGVVNDRVPKLRERMKRFGYRLGNTTSRHFDHELELVLKEFQRTHGLAQSGVYDYVTARIAEKMSGKYQR